MAFSSSTSSSHLPSGDYLSSSTTITTTSAPTAIQHLFHTRSRSASDPVLLPSSLSIESICERELEEMLKGYNPPTKQNHRLVPSPSVPRTVKNENMKSQAADTPKLNGTAKEMKKPQAESNNGMKGNLTNGINGYARVESEGANTKTKLKSVSSLDVLKEGDLRSLSKEELRALCSPSVPHTKIAFVDSLTSPLQNAELVFESYPVPLIEFISPRIKQILKSRTETKRKISANKRATSSSLENNHTSSTTTTTTNTLPPCPPPTGLVLPTPAPRALSLVLAFALESCIHASPFNSTAHAVLSFPLHEHAFYKYARVVDEARFLGWTWLENEMMKRMDRIQAGQVHTNDVERILANTGGILGVGEGDGKGDEAVTLLGNGTPTASISTQIPSSPTISPPAATLQSSLSTKPLQGSGSGSKSWFRTMAVSSIAKALLEGRLRYKYKYDQLRVEYPEFDREIKERIGELKRGE